MNKLPVETRIQILGMMVEGMSLRAIARLTRASKNTIVKFLRDAGEACTHYQDEHLVSLTSKRIQVDEIWSFAGMKQKNVPAERKDEFGVGDVCTWTTIDADSKLAASWLLRDRSVADSVSTNRRARCALSRMSSTHRTTRAVKRAPPLEGSTAPGPA